MSEVKDWIEEWCELWPDIRWNNASIKSEPKHCINKMLKFTKDFVNYDKNTIFAATQMYLDEREEDDWKFTKRSTYFISKVGESSLLKSYCDRVLEQENSKNITNYNSDWI